MQRTSGRQTRPNPRYADAMDQSEAKSSPSQRSINRLISIDSAAAKIDRSEDNEDENEDNGEDDDEGKLSIDHDDPMENGDEENGAESGGEEIEGEDIVGWLSKIDEESTAQIVDRKSTTEIDRKSSSTAEIIEENGREETNRGGGNRKSSRRSSLQAKNQIRRMIVEQSSNAAPTIRGGKSTPMKNRSAVTKKKPSTKVAKKNRSSSKKKSNRSKTTSTFSKAGFEEEDEDEEEETSSSDSDRRYFNEDDLESNRSGFDDEFVIDSDQDGVAAEIDEEDDDDDLSYGRRRGRPSKCALDRSSSSMIQTEPIECVWIDREGQYDALILPESSGDLLLPNRLLTSALDVYETCRRFGANFKLSPFVFEDFCACVASREQNPLLDEIHVQLLRALIKDDESTQVWFGAQDAKDSTNITIHLLDSYTYGEVLRRYAESDARFERSKEIMQILNGGSSSKKGGYPFVDAANRLIVLNWLTGRVADTQAFKKELSDEGMIQHDDHCRDCGKLGELLCCDTCPAVYHMSCCKPPLQQPPSSGWQCEVCKLHHETKGVVTDCRTDAEKTGLQSAIRHDPLGYDRHGRRYWFLARRVFVEDDTNHELRYYSSVAQFRQLLWRLDADDLERELCRAIMTTSGAILKQMNITDELTEERFRRVAAKESSAQKRPYLNVDKEERASEVVDEENVGKTTKSTKKEKKKMASGELDEEEDEEDEGEYEPIGCGGSTMAGLLKRMDVMLDDVRVVLEECNNAQLSTEKPMVATVAPTASNTRSSTPMSAAARSSTPTMINDSSVDGQQSKKMTRSRTGHLPKSRLALDPRTGDYVYNEDAAAIGGAGGKSKMDDESNLMIDNDGDGGNSNSRQLNDAADQIPSLKIDDVEENQQQQSEINNENPSQKYFEFEIGPYYKLGQEREFLNYDNLYTSNQLSKSPYLRAEERNRSKYMANRFVLEEHGEFKWPSKSSTTSSDQLSRMLFSSLLSMANRIHTSFLHPRLSNKEAFYAFRNCLIQSAKTIAHFGENLAKFEANARPILFSETYKNALGHTRLYRSTVDDREERQQREKQRRAQLAQLNERCQGDPNDTTTNLIWVKYSLLGGPPKHQIWRKQRDEAYRVNGDGELGGWLWIRQRRRIDWREYGGGGSAAAGGGVWRSEHGRTIDGLLEEVQKGLYDDQEAIDQPTEPIDIADLQSTTAKLVSRPLCSELPMEYDESTATFVVNRSKAVAQLSLRDHRHSGTIDVSSGLARHSVYYKMAEKSRVLDRLLSHRMKREEEESKEVDTTKLVAELAVKNQCYSADCRRGSTTSCYSRDCARFREMENVISERSTRAPYQLKIPPSSSSTIGGQRTVVKRCNWRVWTKENTVAMPPGPKVHRFRTAVDDRSMIKKEAEEEDEEARLRNILILPNRVVKKMARKGGVQENVEGFNHTAKPNTQVWPYPCYRPTFQTCWRYQLQNARSLHSMALLFRIFYHNIKWDQLAANRELDAIYTRKFENSTEQRTLGGHQFQLPDGLHVRFLVRFVRASNDYRSTRFGSKNGGGGGGGASDSLIIEDRAAIEDVTSDEEDERFDADFDADSDEEATRDSQKRKSNASYKLRERKQPKRQARTKTMEKWERWMSDEELSLWEIKNYWLRKERDARLAAKQSAINSANQSRAINRNRPSPLVVAAARNRGALSSNPTMMQRQLYGGARGAVRLQGQQQQGGVGGGPRLYGAVGETSLLPFMGAQRRSLYNNAQPIAANPVVQAANAGNSPDQTVQFTITMPAPNTSIVVDIGNGNRLKISNVPKVPGGECELNIEQILEPNQTQSTMTIQSTEEGDGDGVDLDESLLAGSVGQHQRSAAAAAIRGRRGGGGGRGSMVMAGRNRPIGWDQQSPMTMGVPNQSSTPAAAAANRGRPQPSIMRRHRPGPPMLAQPAYQTPPSGLGGGLVMNRSLVDHQGYRSSSSSMVQRPSRGSWRGGGKKKQPSAAPRGGSMRYDSDPDYDEDDDDDEHEHEGGHDRSRFGLVDDDRSMELAMGGGDIEEDEEYDDEIEDMFSGDQSTSMRGLYSPMIKRGGGARGGRLSVVGRGGASMANNRGRGRTGQQPDELHDMDREEKKRLQECKSVLTRVIDRIVRKEQHDAGEQSRQDYYRNYRLKRKLERWKVRDVNQRMESWTNEIKKRRVELIKETNREIDRYWTDQVLEKIVDERTTVGWPAAIRPFKRRLIDPPEQQQQSPQPPPVIAQVRHATSAKMKSTTNRTVGGNKPHVKSPMKKSSTKPIGSAANSPIKPIKMKLIKPTKKSIDTKPTKSILKTPKRPRESDLPPPYMMIADRSIATGMAVDSSSQQQQQDSSFATPPPSKMGRMQSIVQRKFELDQKLQLEEQQRKDQQHKSTTISAAELAAQQGLVRRIGGSGGGSTKKSPMVGGGLRNPTMPAFQNLSTIGGVQQQHQRPIASQYEKLPKLAAGIQIGAKDEQRVVAPIRIARKPTTATGTVVQKSAIDDQRGELARQLAGIVKGNIGRGATSSTKMAGIQNQDDEQEEASKLYCICRTPLDRSKFYVQCDTCTDWFHGKCVGITQKMSKQMTTWMCHECRREKERATTELYCVCRTPYDESKPYICCDSCDGWFHCSCVGIPPEQAESMPSYVCPNCTTDQSAAGTSTSSAVNNGEAINSGDNDEAARRFLSPPVANAVSAMTKRLDANDYELLADLIKETIEHQMSWPFRRDVDRTKHPRYAEFVPNHIDLSMIESKLLNRRYSTLSEFSHDVVCIFNNAREYYPSNSPEFQCATVLDQYFTRKLHGIKLAIAQSLIMT